MNRKQAEHILDAYVRMRMREADKDASDALREVILDAMTGYKTETYGGLVYHPGGTVTIPTRYAYGGTGDPNVVKPSVTMVGSTAEIVGYKDGIVKVREVVEE